MQTSLVTRSSVKCGCAWIVIFIPVGNEYANEPPRRSTSHNVPFPAKRKIPPVPWLLLSPQRPYAFAGSPVGETFSVHLQKHHVIVRSKATWQAPAPPKPHSPKEWIYVRYSYFPWEILVNFPLKSNFSEYFIDIETLWLYYILWIAM